MTAFAATAIYKVKKGDTLDGIAAANHITLEQLVTLNPQLIKPGQRLNVPAVAPTPSPVPSPTPAPTPTPPPVSSEVRFTAYTTGYAAEDNTPPGATTINLGGHSGNAGGTGTYANPITFAVGGSIINGKEIDDYPYGTIFYVPNLRRYFVATDFCGDGSSPQTQPCHIGYQGHPWLDLYVGPQATGQAVLTCEDNITNLHLVIEHPAPNYAVVSGNVFNGTCSAQYGDTVL